VANAYTTHALLLAELGTSRLTMLCDRDLDGVADTGVEDDAINKAGTLIDARLSRRYTTPFAAQPSTPDLVEMIATYLTCHVLYKRYEASGDDQAYYWRQSDALMNDILAGRTSIPGATEVSAEDQFRSVTVSASNPVLAGVDPTTDDPSLTTSTRRTYGM
jgi:phage gp36-like protein